MSLWLQHRADRKETGGVSILRSSKFQTRHRESLIDLTWSGLQVRKNAVAIGEDGSEKRDPGNKEASLESITSHSL